MTLKVPYRSVRYRTFGLGLVELKGEGLTYLISFLTDIICKIAVTFSWEKSSNTKIREG